MSPVFVIIGFLGVGFLIVSNMLFYAVLGEVNGRSRSEDRISVIGVNLRLFEVVRRHRSLFPRSKLRVAASTTGVLGIALFLVAIITGIVRNSQ